MYTSKLNALTFALEGVESIGDAKEFLEEYMQSADINGLAVFDREGRSFTPPAALRRSIPTRMSVTV